MRDPAALFRLDPFRAEAVTRAPLLENRAEPDDVKKRFLPQHASDPRAMVGVEVAVHSDASRLGEGDRLLDLAPLKVLFAHRCRWDGTRRACMDVAHAQ